MVIDNDPVTSALHMDRSKPIGNSEGDDDRGRLHVKVNNKDSEPIPIIDPLYTTQMGFLLNGASRAMNVDGSVTPATFTLAPTAGLIYKVDSLIFFISDNGTMDYTDFGVLVGALANGLLFRSKSNGNTKNIITVKDNIDIAMAFRPSSLLAATATNVGFFNDTDFYIGELPFESPITLKQSTADSIVAVVQDNLSDIDHMRCLVKYRLIP